eukprot:343861-Alexandrium_andersonii.AAC.1
MVGPPDGSPRDIPVPTTIDSKANPPALKPGVPGSLESLDENSLQLLEGMLGERKHLLSLLSDDPPVVNLQSVLSQRAQKQGDRPTGSGLQLASFESNLGLVPLSVRRRVATVKTPLEHLLHLRLQMLMLAPHPPEGDSTHDGNVKFGVDFALGKAEHHLLSPDNRRIPVKESGNRGGK